MANELSFLVHQAMLLPISERAVLAQRLWKSLETPVVDDADDQTTAVADAKRRDAAELDADPSSGRSQRELAIAFGLNHPDSESKSAPPTGMRPSPDRPKSSKAIVFPGCSVVACSEHRLMTGF